MGYESKTWKTKDIDKHGPPPLPLGVYKCEFTKAEAKDSKNGNPMIEVTINAIANLDGERVKAEFRDFLTFTDGAVFKVRQALEAADLEVENLGNDMQLREELAEALVGVEFWAVLAPQASSKGDGREFTGLSVYLTENEIDAAVERINGQRQSESPQPNGVARKSSVVRRRS